MILSRKEEYYQAAKKNLNYLNDNFDENYGFPDSPSWGYAFTFLASLALNEGNSSILSEKSKKFLIKQDKNDINFSWEFVVYAIQQSRILSNDLNTIPFVSFKEKGTRMYNWYLLRVINKVLLKKDSWLDHLIFKISAKLYTNKSGLILDEFRTRSLQYHAFCLFIICDLIDNLPNAIWLKSWLVKGVEFSLDCIFNDGTALYLGRGQEQIFGYGSLIYALEYCNARVKSLDSRILDVLCQKVLQFQREDGSFPLVLRNRESESGYLSFNQDKPHGWYGYNTLFDYQPFLAYCMLKVKLL